VVGSFEAEQATASATSHYFGIQPSITLEKTTNGQNPAAPTGPLVPVGDPVDWAYMVTNTGNINLTDLAVVDDQGVTVTCPATTLAVGGSVTCTASGTAWPASTATPAPPRRSRRTRSVRTARPYRECRSARPTRASTSA
jgi:hypothetical protein